MRKPVFVYAKTKTHVAKQRCWSAPLFSLHRSLYVLNLKFSASSLAVQPSLCHTWSEILKTGLPMTQLISTLNFKQIFTDFNHRFSVNPLFIDFNIISPVGLSNHARLDIRRFGSGIRIHPKVRIVSHRIYEIMFAWYMQDHIVESQTIL